MITRSRTMNFRKLPFLFGTMAALALVLAACQSKSTPISTQAPTLAAAATDTPVPQAMATSPVSAFQEPTISVASNSTLGNILVDGKGMTLYLFTKDTANTSNCNAQCLALWPPLLTQGKPVAGSGVDASLLGSTTLSDGRMIVTYNQAPLYTFSKDTTPGETNGENVASVWFAVSPQGQKVAGNVAGPTAAPTANPGTGAMASGPATVGVETDPTFGQILDNGNGQTLYVFTKDTPDKSNCNAKCLSFWPPLLTQGKPVAGMGVDASLLSTTTLTNGEQIVTYDHMPLYTFAKDTKPGSTAGEGVAGSWFVLTADGKLVKPAATPTPSSAVAFQEPTISVAANAKYGNILVDGKGMTLYMFTMDTADKATCSGGCLAYWPPLLTQGKPIAGTGVDASKLGTTTLADGRMIVTYNHMPLYYWASDKNPGDTTGVGVQTAWYLVAPDGTVVGK